MAAHGHLDIAPDWYLDELGTIGRENLDPDHAARYDAKEDADAKREVERLQTLGWKKGGLVVGLGAGTGQFALAAAATGARVVAVDPSPVMLAVLGRKLEKGPVPSVELVQAGFLSYEHVGPAPSLVYSRYALHHLPDFWKAVALDRVHRLLEPGGMFRLRDVVFGFEPANVATRVEAWCAAGAAAPAGGWTRADYAEHVRDEHSTFTWLLEPILEHVGFAIEDVEYLADDTEARYILRRR